MTGRSLLITAMLSLGLAVGPVWASASRGGVLLDPENRIRQSLLDEALAALDRHAPYIKHKDRIGVVDYDLPSTAERFFILDLESGSVDAFLTAHGRGSDLDHDGLIDAVSDEVGSGASSVGAYLTAGVYCGQNGKTLLLHGLDATNANAFMRQIVLHATYMPGRVRYMNRDFIEALGKPGRSCGCFVILAEDLQHVIGALEGGRLIYAGASRSMRPLKPVEYPKSCEGPPIETAPKPGICDWPK